MQSAAKMMAIMVMSTVTMTDRGDGDRQAEDLEALTVEEAGAEVLVETVGETEVQEEDLTEAETAVLAETEVDRMAADRVLGDLAAMASVATVSFNCNWLRLSFTY